MENKLLGYDGCFASRLRELMDNANVTQQVLAHHISVTRQAISQYAEGSAQPTIEKLFKIAQFFNVSADYLIGNSDIKSVEMRDKAINAQLGLSEITIKELSKAEVEKRRLSEVAKNTGKAIPQYMKAPMNLSNCINILFDDYVNNPDSSALLTIMEVLSYERELNPVVLFMLKRVELLDADKFCECPITESEQEKFLSDNDIMAIRLLRANQSLARLKKELDENK